MDAMKYVTILIMFGMLAKGLWTLAGIAKVVWEHRDNKE